MYRYMFGKIVFGWWRTFWLSKQRFVRVILPKRHDRECPFGSRIPNTLSSILVRRCTIKRGLLILLTLNLSLLLLPPAPHLFYNLLPPSCSHAQVIHLNNLLHDLIVPLEFRPTLEYRTFEHFAQSVLPLLLFLPPSLLRLEIKLHITM